MDLKVAEGGTFWRSGEYVSDGPDCHLSSVFMVVFRYNLLFFVSGGGKFNYQGTKRWLEDNLDHTGAAQKSHTGLAERNSSIHAARSVRLIQRNVFEILNS